MGEKLVETKTEGEKKATPAEGVVKAAEDVGKKEEAPMAVVLKLDLHCEGCAKKVKRSVRHLEGVEAVKADCDAKKLTVTGNVDPAWLREKVETKTKKKVELISPHPNKIKPAEEKIKADQDIHDDSKKPKEAAVSTVIMKTKLHCDGCAHKIKRIINKNFDGVDTVTTDLQKDLIAVVGKMDTNELISYLRDKLKRGVEIVPPKKDDKEKAKAAGDEVKKVKESEVGDGGVKQKESGDGHKKEVETKPESGGGGEMKVEVSKMEHHSSYNSKPETHYAMPMPMVMYGHQDFGMPMHHHDQSHTSTSYVAGPPLPPPIYLNSNDNMFSDENPNGCYVM